MRTVHQVQVTSVPMVVMITAATKRTVGALALEPTSRASVVEPMVIPLAVVSVVSVREAQPVAELS